MVIIESMVYCRYMFATIKNHSYRYATAFALITAVISGTNNFLTKIAVTAVKDPIVYTMLKNAIVAAFLIGIILMLGKWREIISLTRGHMVRLLAIGAIGGSVPFALFFTGLMKTSALNAGLIHKTLFVWVLLLAMPFLKERFSWVQWVGVGTLFAANFVVGGFIGFNFNMGELMVLGATLLWAVENVIAKIALRDISSITVAGARMIIGSLILFIVVLGKGSTVPLSTLSFEQWGWTVLTSVLLLGYVLTWYTALKHAPATYVAALLVPATLVTNALSAIFITHTLNGIQLTQMALLAAGSALIVLFAKKAATVSQQISPQASA